MRLANLTILQGHQSFFCGNVAFTFAGVSFFSAAVLHNLGSLLFSLARSFFSAALLVPLFMTALYAISPTFLDFCESFSLRSDCRGGL